MEDPATGQPSITACGLTITARRLTMKVKSARWANLVYEAHGLDDAARRLFALLHAAAAGNRAGRKHHGLQRHPRAARPPSPPRIRSGPNARIITTPASARNSCPDYRWGWTATTRPLKTNSTMDCSDSRSFFPRSIIRREWWRAWNLPPATRTAGSRRTPTSPTRLRKAKVGPVSAVPLARPGDCKLRQQQLDLPRPRSTNHRLVRSGLHLGQKRPHCSTRAYLDAIYGSGLRQDGTETIDGTPVADGLANPFRMARAVPSYYTLNLGAEQTFRLSQSQALKARVDVVNLTDNSYELRSGSGVGVNAAQWGARARHVFGSTSVTFSKRTETA